MSRSQMVHVIVDCYVIAQEALTLYNSPVANKYNFHIIVSMTLHKERVRMVQEALTPYSVTSLEVVYTSYVVVHYNDNSKEARHLNM